MQDTMSSIQESKHIGYTEDSVQMFNEISYLKSFLVLSEIVCLRVIVAILSASYGAWP